jgi:hypothetical protein
MFHSSTFITQCRRLPETAFLADNPDLHQAEALFLRHAPNLPGGIASEVFVHAVQSDRSPEELPQYLADLVDLLWMQYDDDADPLHQDDWTFLRDLVDENAVDLDLTLVQYVMERVVSHHALDEQ